MRQFEFVLYHGKANRLKTTATLDAITPGQALDAFCTEMRCDHFGIRYEQPGRIGEHVYNAWSAACDISGQRIYIKERMN